MDCDWIGDDPMSISESDDDEPEAKNEAPEPVAQAVAVVVAPVIGEPKDAAMAPEVRVFEWFSLFF